MSIQCYKFITLALLLGSASGTLQAEGNISVANEIEEKVDSRVAQAAEKFPSLSSVSGPILGMVFDNARSGLRPILGIPGAATLGEVLVLGRAISRAWVSPRQDFALVESKDNGALVVVSFDRGSILIRPLRGISLLADQISLSPTGVVAAIFQRDGRNVQIVTGLPNTPWASSLVNVPALPGGLTAMAVSDDAEAVLLGVSDGRSGAVVLLTRAGQSHVINLVGHATAISFLRNSHDALIADRRNNAILLMRDVTGAAATTSLAGEREGITHPVAVEASDDNRMVFVANAGSRTLLTLDLDSGKVARLGCNCNPTGLYRLRGNSVFRLTDLSDTPLQLLDGGALEPRILFVPALKSGIGSLRIPVLPERDPSRPLRTGEGRR